jgi:phage gp46-like protein
MKKLGITIFTLLFAGIGMVNAQQPQQRNTQMRNYFQQTVLPFVEQQQAKFEKALSTSEKATLTEIRKEMADFRKQGAQMRKAMQGNFNQQAWDSRKAQFDAIVAKARKLADSHPKEAEAYKKAMETEIAKWKAHMPAMAQGKMGNQSRGHGMMGKNPQSKMQKMSDPAFGLLMDGSQMNNMMMHHQRGMNGNRSMKGNGQMDNMSKRRHVMMRAMRNPEVKAKVKAYAEENIFPVIGKERAAFDKVLSKKEKKTIAEIRQQMQAQKDKMMQMRQNGKMAMNDSARLAMRQKMDKNRVALRQIVLNHYGEIQKQMAPLKEKMPQWRADIRNIVMPNRPQQQFSQNGKKSMPAKMFPKDRGDIMFLLFDPQHPENNMFMQPMPGSKMK